MQQKSKEQSIIDYLKGVGPSQVVSIAQSAMTREDWRLLWEDDSAKRIEELMRAQSDQEAALLIAGSAETLLRNILILRGEGRRKTLDSNFSSLIHWAAELGIVTDRHVTALNAIRKVRNEFAHDTALTSMEHDDAVLKLLEPVSVRSRPPEFSVRRHFVMVGMAVCAHLQSELNQCKTQPLPPSSNDA